MTKNFKIGSAISLGMAGLVAFLIIWIYSLKADKASLEWDLAAKDAEIDTVWVKAEYSIPDTVWRTRIRIQIDTISGQVDTIYEDIPGPIFGSIKIDTTKELGPPSNIMSIRVVGEFWYPEKYSNRNWLLIHPKAEKTPYKPLSARSRGNKSIGIAMAFNSNSELMGLAEFKYKRFSVYGGYSIPGKYYLTGMGLRLMEW